MVSEERDLTLPGNPRYQPKDLKPIFGYDNLYRPVGEVELAALKVLAEMGVIPQEDFALLTPEIRTAILDIRTTEVDRVEREVTKHDVRAWVRIAQGLVPPQLGRWLHVLLTSYDPLDTARSIMFLRAHNQVVRPKLVRAGGQLADLAERFADQVQIGRTHGQHAVPITVGFWLATILNRILVNLALMDQQAATLTGKISGPVGAYNAQVAFGIDASFEERVLAEVGLKPGRISTQILQLEHLAHYLFSCVTQTAAIAQLGIDCRHLMRTEIAEVKEDFEAGQTASSSMPHKRNPYQLEGLEGRFRHARQTLGLVTETLTSEHQRDLVGSSLTRDFPIIVIDLVYQLDILLRGGAKDPRTFLERLMIDREALKRNLAMQSNVFMAEPVYIALQMGGYEKDAHKLVNERAVRLSQDRDIPILRALEVLAEEDEDVSDALARIPENVRSLLGTPEIYTGRAREKALEIVGVARDTFRS